MNGRTIGYYASTGLIALAMAGSCFGYLSGAMDGELAHLGYNRTFTMLLGGWKGLAAVALAAPMLPAVKEWAYAGLFFTFTGAIVAHLGAGDGVGGVVAPVVFLGLLGASYVLRPGHLKMVPATT